MKRKLATRFMVCLFLVISAKPGQCLLIEFSPASQSVDLGMNVAVDVILYELNNTTEQLGAFDLSVTYNTNILSNPSVTFDNYLGDINSEALSAIVFTDGLISFFEMSLLTGLELATLQSSQFILATLSFTALAEGLTSLDFDSVILSDANGDSLGADQGNGSVTVAAPVPEPSTMLLLCSGLAGLAAIRRRFNGQVPSNS
ncbi:MAG: PEP-CTERM sorting domain-containing protein [Syntrophobacteraceae bacterium]